MFVRWMEGEVEVRLSGAQRRQNQSRKVSAGFSTDDKGFGDLHVRVGGDMMEKSCDPEVQL